jgi:hypothetical protein
MPRYTFSSGRGGNHSARQSQPRKALAWVATVVVVIALVFIIWPKPAIVTTAPKNPATHAPASPRADAVTHVIESYGPWTVADGNEPKDSLLFVRLNGAVNAGKSTTVSLDESWEASSTPDVRDIRMQLTQQSVTFRCNRDTVVTVQALQPFILESQPNRIFVFADDGTLHSTPIN